MEKYLQDRAWSMLPCKYREEVKRLYEEFKDVSDRYKDVPCLSDADRRSSDRNIGHIATMRAVFGEHNLTAEEEPERLCKSMKDFHSVEQSDRLHIAAMAMAGMLANSAMYKSYDGIGLDKTECFSRKALEYADALIAKCEEGGTDD